MGEFFCGLFIAELKKCITFASLNQIGALVQLVRIRACHARGHEFESRTHRKEKNSFHYGGSFFIGVYIIIKGRFLPSLYY